MALLYYNQVYDKRIVTCQWSASLYRIQRCKSSVTSNFSILLDYKTITAIIIKYNIKYTDIWSRKLVLSNRTIYSFLNNVRPTTFVPYIIAFIHNTIQYNTFIEKITNFFKRKCVNNVAFQHFPVQKYIYTWIYIHIIIKVSKYKYIILI